MGLREKVEEEEPVVKLRGSRRWDSWRRRWSTRSFFRLAAAVSASEVASLESALRFFFVEEILGVVEEKDSKWDVVLGRSGGGLWDWSVRLGWS